MRAKGRGLTNAQLLDHLREQGIVISAPSLFRVLKQLAEQKAASGAKRGNRQSSPKSKNPAPSPLEIAKPAPLEYVASEPVPRASSFRVRRDRDEI